MHVAGYKYNEIAEHTGLPLGTIKSRIFTARKKLQERFRLPIISFSYILISSFYTTPYKIYR